MITVTTLFILSTSWLLNDYLVDSCLSKEQFLATLDRSKTLVFEATVLQLTATFSQNYQRQDAYVRINKIVHQPPFDWQLSPGNVAHIREIRPRNVDPLTCLPKIDNNKGYVWVTWSAAMNMQTREDSLRFYPGGLFHLDDYHRTQDKQQGVVLMDSAPHQPQHDAAFIANQNPPTSNAAVWPQKASLSTCDLAPCPMTLEPVCGTDGVLYQNLCLLQQRACLADQTIPMTGSQHSKPIPVDYSNKCQSRYSDSSDSRPAEVMLCASNNLCAYGSVCLSTTSLTQAVDSLHGHLFFPSCDCDHHRCSVDRPSAVCATDGETYSNECFLKKSMCVTQQMKRIRYYGSCASNPCVDHSCRWPGERCEVDETGQPRCVCPDPCPQVVLPVCGSDGISYDSHCHLERTACLKMRDIWVVHAGQCSDEPQCQALGLYCQGYEICSRSKAPQIYHPQAGHHISSAEIAGGQNGQATIASCVCPVCPEKALGGQVCGTDGRTYRSECHLRVHACQYQLYEVKVRSRGPCDACSNKQCKHYAICQRNIDGESQCICPTDCPYSGVGKQVCGTDDYTYENECHLKVRSCAEQRDLFVASEGPCKSCPNGCPLGYQCRNGGCVCRDACPASMHLEPEVCGTDGKLYRSECELKRQACMHMASVEVDPSGVKCGQRINPIVNLDRPPIGALPQSDEIQPPACTCNKIGALSEHCDHKGQCRCKWGVGGVKCDQCIPGYWGIKNGHQCIACSCHAYGALSVSCDQMTGQCDCRSGVVGRQCSICPNGGRLTSSGCTEDDKVPDVVPEVKPTESADGQVVDSTTTVKITGRLFNAQTTLLIRAPTPLDQPVSIEMHVIPASRDGILVQYRAAPSAQEQMLVHNLQDHQFSLSLVGGRVVCSYLNGRFPDRLLMIESSTQIQLNSHYIIRAGVFNNQPWLQLNNENPSTDADIAVRRINTDSRGTLHVGGYRTVVVGCPLLAIVQSAQTIQQGEMDNGFAGCLLKLLTQTGYQKLKHEVDLISGDRTQIAWIGVSRLASGLFEAPLCFGNQETSMPKKHLWDMETVQSDARSIAPSAGNQSICGRNTPCQNGGVCVPPSTSKYDCICQPGWQGEHCEHMVTVIPQFAGTSFIRLPGPSGKQAMRRRRLQLGLTFLISKTPGLLLLIPPGGSGRTGPFVAAYVDDQKYLVVVCRIGVTNTRATSNSRIVLLRYKVPVVLNLWHTVTIEKLPKVIGVRIDQNEYQKIRLMPNEFGGFARRRRQQSTSFDLSKSPIYLGGYPFQTDPITYMDIHSGLVGAIQKVIINGAEAVLGGPPLTSTNRDSQIADIGTEHWQSVIQWQGIPCGPNYNPCHADRPDNVCRPQGQTATCACSTPLQLLKIIAEQAVNDMVKAEEVACTLRQDIIRANSHNSITEKFKTVGQSDMQYDGLSAFYTNRRGDASVAILENAVPGVTESRAKKCGQESIRFDGKSMLKFKNLVKSTDTYNIRLQLQSTKQNGLVLLMMDFVGESAKVPRSTRLRARQSEMSVIAVRNGRVEFSIHAMTIDSNWTDAHCNELTGRTTATMLHLKSGIVVNDGQCHTVHAVRSRQRATLIIDNYMTPGEFTHHSTGSNTQNLILMGGAYMNIVGFPWEYQQNMTGYLADMFVNEQKVTMNTSATVISPSSM